MTTAKSIPAGALPGTAPGMLRVGADRIRRAVLVDFELPLTALELTAADARTIGFALLTAADEIEPQAN